MRPRSTILCRRGTSLVEGLIASVLLATSVVGISGTLAASYQTQAQLGLRGNAALAGRKVMETVTAMPLDPAAAGQASLADYQTTSTTTTTSTTGSLLGGILSRIGVGVLGTGVTTTTTTSSSDAPTPTTAATPVVSVARAATLNGAASATGDFAIVTVSVSVDGRQPPIKLRRLVTVAEASGNQTP